MLWKTNKNGNKEFLGGQESRHLAERAALECDMFVADDEDECVSDEPRSCYNCRYRRWTATAFECLKT